MAVTDAQIQTLLVLEVGDNADRLLAANVAALWDRFADKALVSTRLRELYVKRSLIDLARGAIRDQIDYSLGGAAAASFHAHDRVETLEKMRANLYAELQQEERVARHTRPLALGTLTQTAPELPADGTAPPATLDANDPRFAGSPYWPLSRP